ncbi:MAG: ribokinase [Chloroflexus sp.]|jgi:ribokinase|uniref:ribokinase n=1 Tax=Chloroflexus sp. TaxID=1904827 RepID=UPI0021DCC7FE|nr:ribokinase [Chloroflexus sp.]GIV87888.1 MAG: ribokinase [Chloroflexus sp.]
MTPTIIVVGSLNMDLVVRAPRHPQPGETLIGSDFQIFPGGKGANQAVAAARLGARVRMIGRVGVDAFGDALLDAAQYDGVDTGYVQRDPDAATGVALITLDAHGQNTIVVAPGANMRVSEADVQRAEALFQGADVLLMQLECPLDAVMAATELAHRYGVQVVLNPAPARPLPVALLSQIDYLLPNQLELQALAEGETDLTAAIERLQRQGVRNLLVTLGAEGALLATGEQTTTVPAFQVPVVDTVAAGDAFAGAFCVALAEGKPPLEAVRWGNAAGALAVTRAGAQPSLPSRMEVMRLLEVQ